MKLAAITPDAIAQCYLCRWAYKAPLRKRKKLGKPEELTLEDKRKVLEEIIIYHLRSAHDKMLLTKEELPAEEGLLGKTYFNGSRPKRF